MVNYFPYLMCLFFVAHWDWKNLKSIVNGRENWLWVDKRKKCNKPLRLTLSGPPIDKKAFIWRYARQTLHPT